MLLPKQLTGELPPLLAESAAGWLSAAVCTTVHPLSSVMESWYVPALNPVRLVWLELKPETGRTHQIRVHLAAIGAPVMGDVTYGRPDSFGAGRVMLHAASLAFEHPSSGDVVRFDSPLPADMVAVLARLRLRSTDQG